MLLSPRALKSLNNIEKIQARMMCATFNSNPGKTIVSIIRVMKKISQPIMSYICLYEIFQA